MLAASWTGTSFVATGEEGAVLLSSDGSAWVPQDSGTSSALRSVTWTGTRVVAVGDEGTIATSTDGSLWSTANGPLRLGMRGVAWTGAQCVAVGDAGTVATSPDGLTWTLRSPGSFADLRAVAGTASQVIAVGAGGAMFSSTNGITWSSVTPITAMMLNGVARNASRWVAVGDGGTVLSSTNGTSWAAQTSGVTVNLQSLHWDGTRFVAAGADGIAIRSTDGLSWTTISTGVSTEWKGLASGAGNIVVVGDHGGIATTSTATAWTSRSSGVISSIHDAVRAGSTWVAVGEGGLVMSSTTGDAWTLQTSGTTTSLNGVAWSGSLLVAVGDGGTVLTSPDGATWTTRTSGTPYALHSVTYTGSQFIAVGANGTVRISSGGTVWTGTTSGTANLRSIVASSTTQMVAVGDNGTLISSANGTSWTVQSSGLATDLNGVASNGTLFVAVGAGGRIITSSNLVNWSLVSAPLPGTEFNSLRGVRWTGEEFLATGHVGGAGMPGGYTLRSTDGNIWTLLETQPSPPLTVAVAITDQALLLGIGGTVLGDSILVLPLVQFQISSGTIAENGGQRAIVIEASSAVTSTITIPVSLSGTAATNSGGDVTLSGAAFVITSGQSTGTLVATVNQDGLNEPDETLILTLQSSATYNLGGSTVFTLTITDDDVLPAFAPGPGGEVAPAGTTLELGFEIIGGSSMTYQWLKNGVAIATATTARYLLPAVSLAAAGSYRLRVTSPAGTVESPVFELAVVDTRGSTLSLVQGKTVTFTISAAGSGLTYLWKRDGLDLPAVPRITGATTSTLTINPVMGIDSGTYRCGVITPYGSLDGGAHVLTVAVPPVIGLPNVGPLMVSQWTFISIPSGNRPTKFTIGPLPSGLTYNTTTGEISGRPLVPSGAQPFQVVITASNAAGSSAPLTLPLTVLPLPAGVARAFQGTIDRQALLTPTSQLGGRISVTITGSGKATGSVTLGTTTYPFVQPLDTSVAADPECLATIVRKGLPSLFVYFTIQGSAGQLTGTISDGAHATACRAWSAMSSPFTAYTGYYTSGWKLANAEDVGVESIPQGHGYAFFTVSATGTATGTVRLSDGTQIPMSASMRSNGALVMFSTLYGSTGSLLGTLNLTPGAPALVSTAGLSWMKQAQTVVTRSYKAGFGPLALAVAGARYTAPATGSIVMQLPPTTDNVPNAALEFAEGGVPDPASRLNVLLRYTAPAVRDPQTPASNPGKVSLVINAATGLISGSFILLDHDNTTGKLLERKPLLYGLVARDMDGVLRGLGHFQLPRMPDNYLVPPTTSTTSPLLSGKLLLRPLP